MRSEHKNGGETPIVGKRQLWGNANCGETPIVGKRQLWGNANCGETPIVGKKVWGNANIPFLFQNGKKK